MATRVIDRKTEIEKEILVSSIILILDPALQERRSWWMMFLKCSCATRKLQSSKVLCSSRRASCLLPRDKCVVISKNLLLLSNWHVVKLFDAQLLVQHWIRIEQLTSICSRQFLIPTILAHFSLARAHWEKPFPQLFFIRNSPTLYRNSRSHQLYLSRIVSQSTRRTEHFWFV